MGQHDAVNALTNAGFEVSQTEVFSDTAEENRVVSQNPDGGELERGQAVYLEVSRGRDPSKSSPAASTTRTACEDRITPSSTTRGHLQFEYRDIVVTICGGHVVGLVSHSSRVQTDKAICEGMKLYAAVQSYGRRCSVSQYDNLTLYEYLYDMPDRGLAVMRFAVNRNGIVEYISLRTVTDEQNKHEILASIKTL